VARPWNKVIEADDEERPLLENVCFVLCRPQGPQNIGGIARAGAYTRPLLSST